MADQGLPIYYVGRNLSNFRVTPLVIATNGTFTKATSLDIAGLSGGFLTFDSARFDMTAGSEEISPANVTVRNYVLTKDDFELTLTEIKYCDPSNNALAAIWQTYDHFLAEGVVQPYLAGESNPYTVQAVCVRSSLTDDYAEGKGTYELHGKPVGLPVVYVPKGSALVY